MVKFVVQQFVDFLYLQVGDFDYELQHFSYLMKFEMIIVLKPFLAFTFSL